MNCLSPRYLVPHAGVSNVCTFPDIRENVPKGTLTEMQPQLAQAAIDTEILIKKVTADQLAADEQQAIVEKDVEEANKVAANVQVIKDDCQKVRYIDMDCFFLCVWSDRDLSPTHCG